VKTEVKTPCLPTVNQKLGIVQPGTTDIGLSNPQVQSTTTACKPAAAGLPAPAAVGHEFPQS